MSHIHVISKNAAFSHRFRSYLTKVVFLQKRTRHVGEPLEPCLDRTMDSDGPMDSGGPIMAHRGPMGPLGPMGPSWWAHPLPVLAHFHVLFPSTRTDFVLILEPRMDRTMESDGPMGPSATRFGQFSRVVYSFLLSPRPRPTRSSSSTSHLCVFPPTHIRQPQVLVRHHCHADLETHVLQAQVLVRLPYSWFMVVFHSHMDLEPDMVHDNVTELAKFLFSAMGTRVASLTWFGGV
jgi:hypothetical protein